MDRRTLENKPAASSPQNVRSNGSTKPQRKMKTARPAPVASPAAMPAPEAVSLPMVAQTAPAGEIASAEAGNTHPKWITAPPSAPLAAPPLPAVVRTSPNNRIDRRVIYLASLVIGAVLLVAGVGYKLVASTDEGKPPVVQPEAPKTSTKSTIGP